MTPTVLLSAGEPSGDLHGAAVARELKRRWPDARLFGIGGPRMAEQGVELLAELDRLAVMGFVEVLAHLPYFVRLFGRLRREVRARETDLVIPIDYPGFNLRLAASARRAGVPVLYYIAPQVWAWHRSRMHKLAHSADRLAVVLPFEEAMFREEGARVSFVGHPLLDLPAVAASREAFCRPLGLDAERPILALFPGSRAQEVERHLPLFRDTAARVREEVPAVQPVIASSENVSDAIYAAADWPRTADSRPLLHHARAALVKSGTTTLEAALAGTPLVIAYQTHSLTYRLARCLVRVDHIGLVNLVAGKRLAPEYVQGEATPAALATELLPLLEGGPARRAMIDGLGRVRAALAPTGADSSAGRVGQLAAELIQE